MEKYHLERAKQSGAIFCLVSKEGKRRYVLASSLTQCQAKFTGWAVQEISEDEFIKNQVS